LQLLWRAETERGVPGRLVRTPVERDGVEARAGRVVGPFLAKRIEDPPRAEEQSGVAASGVPIPRQLGGDYVAVTHLKNCVLRARRREQRQQRDEYHHERAAPPGTPGAVVAPGLDSSGLAAVLVRQSPPRGKIAARRRSLWRRREEHPVGGLALIDPRVLD